MADTIAVDCASYYGVYDVPGSSPGVKHRVMLNGDAGTSCSCPAWRFSEKAVWDRTCKHITRVLAGACLRHLPENPGTSSPSIWPVDYTVKPANRTIFCPACDGLAVTIRVIA